MTLTFVDRIPRRVKPVVEVEPTPDQHRVAEQAKANPNKFALLAERTTSTREHLPLRKLGLRVALQVVDREEYTTPKGKLAYRRVYNVWVGYIVPVAIDGTEPAANGAAKANAQQHKRR